MDSRETRIPNKPMLYSAVPATSLSLSIISTGSPIAGSIYDILCRATVMDGIQSTPIFTWLDPDGNRIVNGGNITVGSATATSLPLEFGILRSSYSGEYTCRVTLYSLALQAPLIVNTSIIINVQRKFV